MPCLAVQCDIFPAVTHDLGNCFVKIQLSSVLVEITKLYVDAPLDRSGVGFDLAEQQPKQGTLTDPVVPYKTNPVSSSNTQGEVPDQHLISIAKAEIAGIQHLAPGLIGFFDMHPCPGVGVNPLGAHLTHRLQRADAPLISRTPCLNPLAYPYFLLCQLSVELGIDLLLGFQGLGPPSKKIRVVSRPTAQLAPVDLNDPGRKTLQKCPIVGDKQHRTGKGRNPLLQPGDRLKVQVIGRFIQQQQIRPRGKRPGKRCPTAPTP